MQNVVYGEYLPKILGETGSDEAGVALPDEDDGRTGYKPHANPGIFNSFATAAYRFGHSMIQGLIQMFTVGGVPAESDEYDLSDHFFNLERYEQDDGLGLEQILAGLINQVL